MSHRSLMLSVIIATEGVEQPVVATLAALVPGAAAGVIREVLLVDRAATGEIERVADVAGCHFLAFEGTRAAALAAALFPDQRELSAELEELGAITGNLRALAVAGRQARLVAKGEPVTLAQLRRVIRTMGGK